MKKFLRRSIFTFIFAFAFLVCGAISVRAAEAALNNTNIKGYNFSFTAEENEYYVLHGKKEDKTIQLSSKQVGQYKGITMKYYTAVVSVVKCGEYDSVQDACKTWLVYHYENKNETKTMDALKQNKLSINFKNLVEDKTLTEINGISAGQLDSIYSVADTYFVVIQYKLQRWPLKDITYNPDILRVVFYDDLPSVEFSKTTNNSNVTVRVTSGTPINTVRYFKSATELAKGYDFETEYTKAGNGVVALETAVANPEVNDGKFSYTVDLVIATGEYYYFEATDLAGVKATYDVYGNMQGDTVPTPIDPPANVGDTSIGKIILFSLVVVFVLAVVLVIVQKIIDYRKKLY